MMSQPAIERTKSTMARPIAIEQCAGGLLATRGSQIPPNLQETEERASELLIEKIEARLEIMFKRNEECLKKMSRKFFEINTEKELLTTKCETKKQMHDCVGEKLDHENEIKGGSEIIIGRRESLFAGKESQLASTWRNTEHPTGKVYSIPHTDEPISPDPDMNPLGQLLLKKFENLFSNQGEELQKRGTEIIESINQTNEKIRDLTKTMKEFHEDMRIVRSEKEGLSKKEEVANTDDDHMSELDHHMEVLTIEKMTQPLDFGENLIMLDYIIPNPTETTTQHCVSTDFARDLIDFDDTCLLTSTSFSTTDTEEILKYSIEEDALKIEYEVMKQRQDCEEKNRISKLEDKNEFKEVNETTAKILECDHEIFKKGASDEKITDENQVVNIEQEKRGNKIKKKAELHGCRRDKFRLRRSNKKKGRTNPTSITDCLGLQLPDPLLTSTELHGSKFNQQTSLSPCREICKHGKIQPPISDTVRVFSKSATLRPPRARFKEKSNNGYYEYSAVFMFITIVLLVLTSLSLSWIGIKKLIFCLLLLMKNAQHITNLSSKLRKSKLHCYGQDLAKYISRMNENDSDKRKHTMIHPRHVRYKDVILKTDWNN